MEVLIFSIWFFGWTMLICLIFIAMELRQLNNSLANIDIEIEDDYDC